MRPAFILRTIGWMIRDTFRQSLAYGIFWILLVVTGLCVLVCASARIEGCATLAAPGENPDFLPRDDPDALDAARAGRSGTAVVSGELTLGFGSLEIPLARDGRDAVRFLQLTLAGGVADTLGVLLCLVWTAGFLPGFLAPQSVSVLLARPPTRGALLAGKYLGVLAFVAFHSALFLGGTWLALGAATGVWDVAYLLAFPLLLLQFAVFFSFSLLLAATTLNAVACVFGSLVFWLLCWGMNYGWHALAAGAGQSVAGVSAPALHLAQAGYWVLPKPVDFGLLLFDALQAQACFGKPAVLAAAQAQGAIRPFWSIATSLVFALVLFLAAKRQFETTDY
jgi:hypothetical protein